MDKGQDEMLQSTLHPQYLGQILDKAIAIEGFDAVEAIKQKLNVQEFTPAIVTTERHMERTTLRDMISRWNNNDPIARENKRLNHVMRYCTAQFNDDHEEMLSHHNNPTLTQLDKVAKEWIRNQNAEWITAASQRNPRLFDYLTEKNPNTKPHHFKQMFEAAEVQILKGTWAW